MAKDKLLLKMVLFLNGYDANITQKDGRNLDILGK